MFERFTSGSRAVVQLAQQEARALGHGYVGTEHLLLGLLAEGEGVAAHVLGDAGLTAGAVRAHLERLVGDPLLTGPDAEALRAIGIEVAEVRARVEESFGPGALERARFRKCRQRPVSGHVPFSPRSKKVLELSLREAIRLHHNYIGTEHILLGLLREGEGLAARILAEAGVRADDLRGSVMAALGRVA